MLLCHVMPCYFITFRLCSGLSSLGTGLRTQRLDVQNKAYLFMIIYVRGTHPFKQRKSKEAVG